MEGLFQPVYLIVAGLFLVVFCGLIRVACAAWKR
jgi:hypothetical protein